MFPRASLDDMVKWTFFTLPGVKLRHLGHSACSQLLYRMCYHRSENGVLLHKWFPQWESRCNRPKPCVWRTLCSFHTDIYIVELKWHRLYAINIINWDLFIFLQWSSGYVSVRVYVRAKVSEWVCECAHACELLSI
jgi:hypothetical protein